MSEATDRITISEDAEEVGNQVEAALLTALRVHLPQSDNERFVLSARDRQGRVVAGLTASTSYGWLLVKNLWVAETERRRGLGQSLMEQAEERGRKIGCHAAWLDTSNPDAMHFYTKLGYAPFGKLANSAGQFPAGHCRWFMQKAL